MSGGSIALRRRKSRPFAQPTDPSRAIDSAALELAEAFDGVGEGGAARLVGGVAIRGLVVAEQRVDCGEAASERWIRAPQSFIELELGLRLER